MTPLELTGHARLGIPLDGGMVTRYSSDKLQLGQAELQQNLVHTRQGLLRRPAVQMVTASGVLDRIYSLHRWYAPNGKRYLIGFSPNNADPESADGLRLVAREEDDLTADGAWATVDNRFFLRVALRRPVSAVLRELFIVSDGLHEIKFIKELVSGLTSATSGPLGYLPPQIAPVIASATEGGSPEENALPHGIYQVASSFVYDDDQHSNPGPRSNIIGAVNKGRTDAGLGLSSLELTGLTTGSELDSSTQARVEARSFPARYKAFADDLFNDWIKREEKAGLTGTTHSSTDSVEGQPATDDNDLPPVPTHLVSVRNTLVAIGNKGPVPKKPWDAAEGEPIQTERVARIRITNPNPRTETRLPFTFTVPFSSLVGYGNPTGNGKDLVLTDDDQVTILPYLAGYGASSVTFTVQLPELGASSVQILYLHYESTQDYSGFVADWEDVYQPELTRRTDLAHFYMDEPAEEGPVNRANDYPADFVGTARWSQTGDLDGPPFNHTIAYRLGETVDHYVRFLTVNDGLDFGTLGLTATPQQFSHVWMQYVTGTEGGPLLSYGTGNAGDMTFSLVNGGGFSDDSIHLYPMNGLVGPSFSLGVGAMGNWFTFGLSARKNQEGDWLCVIVAVDMHTGQSWSDESTIAGSGNGLLSWSSTRKWYLNSPGNRTCPYGGAKNHRMMSYAASADEMIALAARKGFMDDTPTVAIEEIEEATTERPDHSGRIYFSKTGLPHAWPTGDQHVIREEDDGGHFIGALPLRNALVAFKSNRIHVYHLDNRQGFWTDQENLDIVAQRVGLAAPHALTLGTLVLGDQELEVVFFVGSDRRVYAFDGEQLHWIGEPIDDLLANKTGIALARTTLVFDPRRRLLLLGACSVTPAAGGDPLNKAGGGGDDVPEEIDGSPSVIVDSALVMSTEFYDPPIFERGLSRPRWGSWIRSSDSLFHIGPHVLGDGPGDNLDLLWAGAAWDDPRLYTLDDSALTDNWTGTGIAIQLLHRTGLIQVKGQASWRTLLLDYVALGAASRSSALSAIPFVRDPYTRALSQLTTLANMATKRLYGLPKGTLGDAIQLQISGSDNSNRLELLAAEIEARPTGLRRGY